MLDLEFSKMGRTFGMSHLKLNRGILKRIPLDPWFLIRALNSSVVLDATTEEGRLFHNGIVLRKSE